MSRNLDFPPLDSVEELRKRLRCAKQRLRYHSSILRPGGCTTSEQRQFAQDDVDSLTLALKKLLP